LLALFLNVGQVDQVVLGVQVGLLVDDPVLSQDVQSVPLPHVPHVEALEDLLHCAQRVSRAVGFVVEERSQVLQRN
jgi:hypothetical protein